MAFVSSLVMSFIYCLILYFLADSIRLHTRDWVGDITAFVILVATFGFGLCWYFVEKLRLKIKRDTTPLYTSQEKFVIILMENNSIVTYFQEQQNIFKMFFSIKDDTLESTQLFSTKLPLLDWKEVTHDRPFVISPLSITREVYSYYSKQNITAPLLLNIEHPSCSMLYSYIKDDLALLQENKKINAMVDFQKQILYKERSKILLCNLLCYFAGFLTSVFFSVQCGVMGFWLYLPRS